MYGTDFVISKITDVSDVSRTITMKINQLCSFLVFFHKKIVLFMTPNLSYAHRK